ncbi:unnamed protein product [Meloidogyne enterolobii]|uniref:Uncharacterized protein n=1 Tax=Meloidogyne enterolobii TaxID=390850 RepID=A0ACB0YZJ5_MELEN
MKPSLNLLKFLKCNSSIIQQIQSKCAASNAAFSFASPEPSVNQQPPENQEKQQNDSNKNTIITLELEQLQNSNENEKPQEYYNVGRLKNFIAKISANNYFEEKYRMSLIKSSAKLYYDCSNNFNFITLHKEFGLEDDFGTWYRLTLLHIWMILTRLQQTMEAYSYCYVKKMITQNFHHDKTNRYNTVYKDQPSLKLKRRSNFRQLYYDVYMNSLFEYDDGFLGDDKYLAAAVWRALYLMEDEADIIYIERVVRYIRATLHFLDKIDTEILLEKGLDKWEPADEIVKKRVKLGEN